MLKSSTILHAKHTAKSTAFILVFIYAFSYVGTPKENGLALTLGLFFIRVKNKLFNERKRYTFKFEFTAFLMWVVRTGKSKIIIYDFTPMDLCP